jgi:outer membrane biosynthesis protein TonB
MFSADESEDLVATAAPAATEAPQDEAAPRAPGAAQTPEPEVVAEVAAAPVEEPAEAAEETADPAPASTARGSSGDTQPRARRSPLRRASTTTPETTPTPTMQAEARPPAMAAASALAPTPTRDQVIAAMRAVAPRVEACGTGARHGVAEVDIVVGSSGRIRSAVVGGFFAGTPEGSCVARAVRGARLPPFQNDSFQFSYPFRL